MVGMDEVGATIDLGELRQRAAALRREAFALLDGAGVLDILRDALGRVEVVGSVALDLMTWPDIDLYSRLEPDESARLLTVLSTLHARLDAHGHALIRVSFHDQYRRPDHEFPRGLYAGLRVLPLGGTPTWKVDLWGWNESSFAEKLRHHEALAAALARADRDLVLRIKDAAARRPSYRDTVTSADVYAFVLADAGSSLADFDAFLARRGAAAGDGLPLS
ncbi:MAG: hypothetical protein ACRDJH_07870 [Thermomicrobiales bacterium]